MPFNNGDDYCMSAGLSGTGKLLTFVFPCIWRGDLVYKLYKTSYAL